MRNVSRKILGFAILMVILSGCENYFGDKTDLSFIELPESNFREVA